jgi:hypothetical protein
MREFATKKMPICDPWAHGPMGPWPYHVPFFFLVALRQCSSAVAGKKVKAGARGEGGLDGTVTIGCRST